jgi:hypothetical protein
MHDADLKPLRRWTRRPLFSPSQMLTAQQLNMVVDDQRAHSEMLMRALHGPGVIFGYAATLCEPARLAGDPNLPDNRGPTGSTWLKISCGMALDRHGRLLHWPEGALSYCEIVNETKCAGTFTLSVHYAERRSPGGGCGPCGDRPEWIEDGVVFTLTPKCENADRDCPKPRDGDCVSWDDYICSRTGSGSGKLEAASDLDFACMDPGGLCRIDCSDDAYDSRAGIPIACVEVANLAGAGCPEVWGFLADPRTCEVRPYVYRTPLLYELIRGCQDNLARVAELGWQDWLLGFPGENVARKGQARKPPRTWDNPVEWRAFADKFADTNQLWIQFTEPIDVTTVHPASVFLTTTRWDRDDEYMLTRRVPTEPPEPVDAKDGYATRFRLVPDEDWIDNVLNDENSTHEGGSVELTIRGQMLRDRCGNMLNSVPLFYDPGTPAQHRPGDDFVAVFVFLAEATEETEPQRQKKQKLLPPPKRARRIY